MTHDSSQKSPRYYMGPRKEMIQFVPDSTSRVLEVGCGDGFFGAELKSVWAAQGREIHITGIEINAVHAEMAKPRLDEVIVANIEKDALNLSQSAFDCIICNDVLEHIISPWQTLTYLRSLLSPNGSIVASIPNIRYWGALKDLLINSDWRYVEEGVLDQTHLRFFTRKSMERMFREAGYEDIVTVGINSHVRGPKFRLLQIISGGRFDDIQYMQFAITARNPTSQ